MFDTIASAIPQDRDASPRARALTVLGRVLDGTFYDALPYAFHEERTAGGDYVPLKLRRPSVRYNLCRSVVDDSVGLLFSEAHFPAVECADPQTRQGLADLARDARLNQVMIEAATRGSVGSVAVLLRVLDGRVFFDALDTARLTPEWEPLAPDTLRRVHERYKVSGATLAAQGYDTEPDATYWFSRVWDAEAETWFMPVPAGGDPGAEPDLGRSVRHGLGFVPIVWVRNLPGPSATGDAADGACTFRAAIETSIEIDYQLSQLGRGLRYSSDPTLLIKEPAGVEETLLRGAGNALVLSEKGDAKLLEIGGTASAAVIEYVRLLRELALESVHGNRASADRLSAPQSGRALELMNQGLVQLADNLRISYGEGALLSLMRMVLRASTVFTLRACGTPLRLDPAQRLSLRWPRWYPQDADDRAKSAQTLAVLRANGLVSLDTAVSAIAPDYDIPDTGAELARIAGEHAPR